MIGFLLAFATACSEALKDILSKGNLAHVDEYASAFSMHLVISVVLAPIVLFYTGIEAMTGTFLMALLISTILQLIVILLYLKALKISQLSTVIPLIALTPLFMLITSPFILGEFPNLSGLAGIVLIVAGTYVLNIGDNRGNIWAPFTFLITNKGSRYMLIVAFLWSVTANIDKVGVEETSPIYWAFAKDLVIMFYLIPIVWIKSKKPVMQLKSRSIPLFYVGIFRTVSVLTQMFAIQYILVAYVIAIKRSSTLLIILHGFLVLKERRNFGLRFAGILTVLAGLVMIAVS